MTMFAGAYDAGVAQCRDLEPVDVPHEHRAVPPHPPHQEYGDPVKDKEALAKLSPMTHIAKLKAPLLLIQGVNDPRVPVGEALADLSRAGAPQDRRRPDPVRRRGPRRAKRGNIVLQIGHTIAFFEKHLIGK